MAIISGSTDNVSAQVIHCDSSPEARFFAVFDGHGGSQISKYLANHYEAVLNEQIQLLLNKKNKPAKNKPVSEYKRYQLIDGDCSQVNKKLNTAFAEVRGLRRTQEDRVIAGEMKGYEQLSEKGRLAVLKRTAAILDRGTREHQYIGSTFSGIMTCDDKIYSTNLGDSTAFAVEMDENGIALKPLYDRLHNVKDVKDATPEDREKLKDSVFPHYKGQSFISKDPIDIAQIEPLNDACVFYLNGDTQLYRAFGDNGVQGLDHVPDIKVHDTGNASYIINACDFGYPIFYQ